MRIMIISVMLFFSGNGTKSTNAIVVFGSKRILKFYNFFRVKI